MHANILYDLLCISANHVAILREVKYKGWLHFITVDWLWYFINLNFVWWSSVFYLPEDGHMVSRNMSDVTVYKTICKILGCILLVLALQFSVPWRISFHSFPSIVFKIHFNIIPLPTPRSAMGLCPSSFLTKTRRAFPFYILCATSPNHLVRLDLMCVWIDLAQDRDSLRALENSVMEFRAL